VKDTLLIVVDMQTKVLDKVERAKEIVLAAQVTIQSMHLLNCPVVFTEQYPEGLAKIDPHVSKCMLPQDKVFSKTAFSCMKDAAIRDYLLDSYKKKIVLIGIEAHVCIYQTAKDLIEEGFEVTILNDVISSYSLYDYSTAIALMRDLGVTISSLETFLFSLLEDAKHPKFKEVQALIKDKREKPSCCCH
jgi:nicotinamidase-related amidase